MGKSSPISPYRVHDSDLPLRQMKVEPIVQTVRRAIDEWRTTTHKAMGQEPLSQFDRQQINDEIRWAEAWLVELQWADELGLTGAVAYCTATLYDLMHQLNHHMDFLPERNRLVPFAQSAMKWKAGNPARTAKGNTVKRRKRDRRDDEISRLFPQISRTEAKRSEVIRQIIFELKDTDLACERSTVEKSLKRLGLTNLP